MTDKQQKQPLLSVVVIGHNEGKHLSRCFHSIENMEEIDGEVETIYVDSGSTDDSIEQAKKHGVIVFEDKSSILSAASARNVGWKAAKGQYILFLDGDTAVNPNFVKMSLSHFSDEKIAIVWGCLQELYPKQSAYHRVLNLDWVYPPGISDFCGGNALVWHAVLEEVGGYNPELMAGEEPEMCRRIRAKGYKILHNGQPMALHNHDMTRFSQYWKRAVRSGYAYAKVAQKFKKTDDPFWEKEQCSNIVRGGVTAGIFAMIIFSPFIFSSALPIYAIGGAVFFVWARTVWKARWKSDDWVSLMLYGVHSHFQQIPILVGQASYWLQRLRGKDE